MQRWQSFFLAWVSAQVVPALADDPSLDGLLTMGFTVGMLYGFLYGSVLLIRWFREWCSVHVWRHWKFVLGVVGCSLARPAMLTTGKRPSSAL